MSNCQKVSYPNKRKAKQAAYAIKCKGYIPARSSLNAYYCKTCQAWHLTALTPDEFMNKVIKHVCK